MKKYSILVFILAIILLSGCGGGGDSSGVIPNNVSIQSTPTPDPGTLVQVPDNQTTPSVPSYLPGGTFNVTVQFPGSDSGAKHRDMSASDLPYNSHTLRVTITGEAIITPLTGERNDLDPSGSGTYTLTVSDVPVGLNTAVIEVIDPSGNLLCQRKHGFYMTPGGTAGPGLIILGVTIQSDGSCMPQNIDIPLGTTLVYQNQDYDNDRTVQMNGGVLTVGPVAHAEHITQPATAEIFHTGTCSFPEEGIYNYDAGYGSPGRVLVYGLPSLTSITDSNGDNKDAESGLSSVSFTLNGTDLGSNQGSVNGSIRFIQIQENDPNNPWGTVYDTVNILNWTDTFIEGSIDLPGGKYRIEVNVRGEHTSETILYYKGSGNFEVIVGDPNSTPTPTQGPTAPPRSASFSVMDYGTGTYQTINDIYFTGQNKGYTVGIYGINYTTDGGNRWYHYPLSVNLKKIYFTDENNGWAAGSGGKIIHTSDGGNTWAEQTSGVTGTINGIYFLNSNNGWAATTGGKILHTVNGGSTWTAQTIGITTDQFYDIYFIDGNNGWISGNKGQILHTSDGGSTWTAQSSGISQTYGIYTIKFLDSNNGWASGTSGEIIHSTDGGNTWTKQHIVDWSTNGFDFHIINQNKLLATANIGFMLNTTDGGNEWNPISTGSGSSFYAIHFIDQNNGWAAGDKGTIARTTDGGATWTVKTHLTAVDFIDANHGWIGGGSTVLHTVNGGNSWTPYNNWTVGYINDIFCIDTDHVYTANVGGGNGSVSISSDGGVNWYNSFIDNTTDITCICFTDVNKGWLPGMKPGMISTLKHTEDGGSLWYDQYEFGDTETISAVYFIDSNKGWVTTSSGIYQSTDGGNSWTLQSSSVYGEIFFIDASNGWVSNSESIYHTTDGGANWTTQTGISNVTSIAFADSSNGCAVSGGETIYYTSNGGSTWTPQTPLTSGALLDIDFTDGQNGFIVGEGGIIIKCTLN